MWLEATAGTRVLLCARVDIRRRIFCSLIMAGLNDGAAS